MSILLIRRRSFFSIGGCSFNIRKRFSFREILFWFVIFRVIEEDWCSNFIFFKELDEGAKFIEIIEASISDTFPVFQHNFFP